MRAGREIRVIVDPGEVDDERATLISHEIAARSQKEMEYPGQIRITVIRESRAISYASWGLGSRPHGRDPVLRLRDRAGRLGRRPVGDRPAVRELPAQPGRARRGGRLLRGHGAATTTFAVLNARDAAHKREAEEAEEAAASASRARRRHDDELHDDHDELRTGKATTLKLGRRADAIAYDTKQLSGPRRGTVTIDFTTRRRSPMTSACPGPAVQQIGCSETVTQGSTSLSENLKPGNYTFFCSVDGHEAAGMKGTLTVK